MYVRLILSVGFCLRVYVLPRDRRGYAPDFAKRLRFFVQNRARGLRRASSAKRLTAFVREAEGAE